MKCNGMKKAVLVRDWGMPSRGMLVPAVFESSGPCRGGCFKKWESLVLTFIRAIWGTNSDVPKKRSIDLEGKQSGIWRCGGCREGSLCFNR